LDIAPVNALVPANKVLGLTPPRIKEFDEVTNQYFTHKHEVEKEGCISVFSPDNVLVKEDFGCCPTARNMVVANGKLFVAGNGQICVFEIATLATLDPIGVGSFKGYQLNELDLNKTTNSLWTTSEKASNKHTSELIAQVHLDSGEISLQDGGAAANSRRHLSQAPAPEDATDGQQDASESFFESVTNDLDSSTDALGGEVDTSEDEEADADELAQTASDLVDYTADIA